MRVIFTKELKMVADDLDRLSKGVHLAIDQAGKALLDSDIDTAQAVIDGDAALDKLENDILNHCVTLLAQQSPVATDLRVVVSTLRLAATFERMGDLARHIAETARRAYPQCAIDDSAREVFEQMQQFVSHASAQLTTILDTRDVRMAERLIINDDKLDALHEKTFELATSDAWPASRQQIIDLVLLGRYYERFGDHAVSVARMLVYMVSGFDPTKEPQLERDQEVS
ncbi:phosphate ABC transporter [Parascardovia denticolens IPLA 20019]|uniref:phosphate signaling complex protein PhoU n=1 Tax=Parascardovia denticolens TaxID=78258 RepID=UPI000266C736|nr:phosphate signaling complex protein PhoU [Parascardovia denticolens]EIT88174.1 phosphate ABC transporter [Parascardovia denticolens IPLA 20019]